MFGAQAASLGSKIVGVTGVVRVGAASPGSKVVRVTGVVWGRTAAVELAETATHGNAACAAASAVH